MRQQLHQSPGLWGIARTRWRLEDLCLWCFAFTGFLSPSGMCRRLKKWKMARQRTRSHLTSPDVFYRQKVAQLVRVQEAAARGEVVLLYGDEHTFYRQPLAGQVWNQAGGGGKEQPRCFRHTASDTKRRTIAALNAQTGQVTWHGCSRSRVKELQHFLKKLRKTDPDGRLVLVWDNWPVHLHPNVLEEASRQTIEIVWLPTYSPWLNPIEKLWKWLKADVLVAHRYSAAWTELRTHVETFLERFLGPSNHLLRYCGLLAD